MQNQQTTGITSHDSGSDTQGDRAKSPQKGKASTAPIDAVRLSQHSQEQQSGSRSGEIAKNRSERIADFRKPVSDSSPQPSDEMANRQRSYLDRKVQQGRFYPPNLTLNPPTMQALEDNPSFKRQVDRYIQSKDTFTKGFIRWQDKHLKPFLRTKVNDAMKQSLSLTFREGGRIQLLSEEKQTLNILDQTIKHPELREDLMRLLDTGSPRVQAALAFRYTSEYMLNLKKLESGSNVLQEIKFSPGAAKDAMQSVLSEKEFIVQQADEILFGKSEWPTTVKVGTAQPREVWTGDQALRSSFEGGLRGIQWQTDELAEWQQHKSGPNRRIILDLSSLNLEYQGQSVRSLEIVGHTIYPERHDPESTQSPITCRDLRLTTDRQVYFASDPLGASTHLMGVIGKIRPFLAGNQFEQDLSKVEKAKAPDSQWQDKGHDWHFSSDDRKTYLNEVHPMLTHYACHVVDHLVAYEQKERITIVDIAGGSGDFSERLIRSLHERFPNLSITYTLVDYSEGDIKIATERYQFLNNDLIHATAECKDMFSYNYNAESMKKDLQLPPEGVDLIINSGGLLNQSIISNSQEAAQFNRMYAQLLKEGGFGLYSGLTRLYVSTNDHHALGLEIHNITDSDTDRQMHIVRRPQSTPFFLAE